MTLHDHERPCGSAGSNARFPQSVSREGGSENAWPVVLARLTDPAGLHLQFVNRLQDELEPALSPAIEQVDDPFYVLDRLGRLATLPAAMFWRFWPTMGGQQYQLEEALCHPLHHDHEPCFTDQADSRRDDMGLHQRRGQPPAGI